MRSASRSIRALIQPKAEPLTAYLSPVELARTLWRQRHVIAQLGRRQIQARHRGSFLGVLWTLLNPLLLLAVYTLVFTELLPVAPDASGNRVPFVLRMFCGIVVMGIFSETVQRAAGVVVANANFVKKVVFPLVTLPAADLYACAVLGAMNLVVVLLAVLVFQGTLHWTIVFFPLVALPLLLLTLGAAWLVAALGVYVRDIAVSIGLFLTVLFLLTPIFYRVETVRADLQWLLRLNPMATVVDATEAVLVLGQAPPWASLGLTILVSAAVAQAGFAAFQACKRGFADVL